MRGMKSRLLATLAACLLSASARADVELVRNGEPVAEIVVAASAPPAVTLAAEDLREHLERMSGAALRIVRRPSQDAAAHVFVGANEFTAARGYEPAAFDNSGLEIVAKSDAVILNGPIKHWKPSPYSMTAEDSRYLNSSTIAGETFPKPDGFADFVESGRADRGKETQGPLDR